MVDPKIELKVRAEVLQKRIGSGDSAARARLRALNELRRASDEELTRFASDLQLKHCLAVVAREAGFASWDHALRVLRGDAAEIDLGTLLHDGATQGMFNAWYAAHDEARAHLDERRARGELAFLLGYKRQFLVVDRHYVEALGLDPTDSDWAAIDFDWAHPREPDARTRLFGKRLAAQRGRA